MKKEPLKQQNPKTPWRHINLNQLNLKNKEILSQLFERKKTKMVNMEKNMRLALQQKVKQNLLETKYAEEPVSYEQALVTYHFMQNAPVQDVA